MLLYHESPVRNRESILERGLLPRRPTWDGNWRSLWFCALLLPIYGWGLVLQPRAVYAWSKDPRPWMTKQRRRPRRDLWVFDYDGPVERDRYCRKKGSRMVRESIPPERLRLLWAAD